MPSNYLKVAIEKNWRSQNFDFLSLKNLSPRQFLKSFNSRRYHWISKLLVAAWKSKFWEQNYVWLFKIKSQIKIKTVMSWSAWKKKEGIFCTIYFVPRYFFKICVLSQCILHWIHFQNINIFIYKKKLLHTLFSLFLKSSKVFIVSLIYCRKVVWNGFSQLGVAWQYFVWTSWPSNKCFNISSFCEQNILFPIIIFLLISYSLLVFKSPFFRKYPFLLFRAMTASSTWKLTL